MKSRRTGVREAVRPSVFNSGGSDNPLPKARRGRGRVVAVGASRVRYVVEGSTESVGSRRLRRGELPEVGMRQVVVLEPAGSVLVIRQTSLGGGNGSGVGNGGTGLANTNNSIGVGSNHHNAHEAHAALTNNGVSTALAPSDHNQNRIVVVRSSSSTCMTSSVSCTYPPTWLSHAVRRGALPRRRVILATMRTRCTAAPRHVRVYPWLT